MSEKFKGVYDIADGYVGGDRPQYFTVHASDLEDDMTESELLFFYEEAAEDNLRERISPNVRKAHEFIAWAKEQISKRSAE